MAKDFNATTSKIVTSYASHATLRTYSVWFKKDGTGEGGLGRVFDKRVAGAQVELLFCDNVTTTNLKYARNLSGGERSWRWDIGTADALHHMVLQYDAGNPETAPIVYVDGSSQSLTLENSGTGTANTNADAYVIGNRGSQERTWDGMICEFAIWDRTLSAAEIGILADGFSPLFIPSSLSLYTPLIREPIDLRGTGALTETDMAVLAHPRIIYPGSYQRYPKVAAAPSTSLKDMMGGFIPFAR